MIVVTKLFCDCMHISDVGLVLRIISVRCAFYIAFILECSVIAVFVTI